MRVVRSTVMTYHARAVWRIFRARMRAGTCTHAHAHRRRVARRTHQFAFPRWQPSSRRARMGRWDRGSVVSDQTAQIVQFMSALCAREVGSFELFGDSATIFLHPLHAPTRSLGTLRASVTPLSSSPATMELVHQNGHLQTPTPDWPSPTFSKNTIFGSFSSTPM